MSSFSPQIFAAALGANLPPRFAGKLCVAFSGGLDSSVLLHALVVLGAGRPKWSLRAVHVDHQLQAASSEWAAKCERVAATLRIPITVERVTVSRDDSQGLEAAARTARYAALRRGLEADEVLLTAHHADDQAETVLLALLRGSGVQGLAAMPPLKKFGCGWHCRPLLGFTRTDLAVWAQVQAIEAIQDPTNALLRHDRNFLRLEVAPQLRQRWPTFADSLMRSAGHLGEALGILEDVAIVDMRACAIERCLSIDALRGLAVARRRNVLRYWLRKRGLPLPSTRKLLGLEHDLFNTDLDRMPRVGWHGAELHWHRGLLYADTPQTALHDSHLYEGTWRRDDEFELPASLGRLSLVSTSGVGFSAARLPERLTIRFRRGGEKLRLPGREHRHSLRNLLQERAVLPWQRDRLPLVFAGTQLLAVGDLAWSADFAAAPDEPALQVAWEGSPEWRAVEPMSGEG